jgi:phenylalanyl-tRNA synthetase beta chain
MPWSDRELADRLTMLGFEVESLTAVAPAFSGVHVARIAGVTAHPQASKLSVCTVDDGSGSELQVVCGASNARAGLRTALAKVGARLPGEVSIGASNIRGVESRGMLCSARELGLGEAAAGILELPDDAPLGIALRDYLHLDEAVAEISITPNRGDAMSVLGLARELAAASGVSLRTAPAPAMPESSASENKPGPAKIFAASLI